jgi:hypothetical protein
MKGGTIGYRPNGNQEVHSLRAIMRAHAHREILSMTDNKKKT